MNIVLKSLDLVHFKCFPKLHLDFHEGVNNIYGENAAGKTSVYDSLTWLLFNKDSAGNARPDIKPHGAPQVHPLKLSAGTVPIEPSSTAASAGQSRNAFAPSVVPPSDTSVNPLAAKASSPMLFTLPSAISDSAAQPLNALSAIDATDEGSVTSARAEHPSNVLGPTAATPDGTTALASAVHPLKAPSAIDVVFSKRRIPPSFSLPASKAGNSAET